MDLSNEISVDISLMLFLLTSNTRTEDPQSHISSGTDLQGDNQEK